MRLAVVVLAACSMRAADFGATVFEDPALSLSTSNVSSCATCHAARGPTRKAGGDFEGVLGRESYWGGAFVDPLDAANFCFVYFMQGARPLQADAPEMKALYEYLATLGTEASAARPFTVVREIADVPRGDVGLGEAVYREACESCHGAAFSGEGKNRAQTPTLPEVFQEYAAVFPGVDPALVVIEKVRHGQFFRVGGNMPLYSREVLSDEELGALLAYLESPQP